MDLTEMSDKDLLLFAEEHPSSDVLDELYCRQERQRLSRELYPFLEPGFLELMNDIGRYGHEKYGELSFHARALKGDHSRPDHPRTNTKEIIDHSVIHGYQYQIGLKHDHFGTLEHQLAAAAFNQLMEWYFARGEKK